MLSASIRFSATFISRIGAAVGGSFLAFLVARQGGPTVLGQFALFVSLLGTIGILTRRGLDVILIRAVAEAKANRDAALPIRLLRTAAKLCLWPSVVMSIAGAALLSSGMFGPVLPGSAVAFVLALPLSTALNLVSGYVKGSGRTWISPLFEIGGISVVACLLVAGGLLIGQRFAGSLAPVVLVVAMGLVSLMALTFLWRDGVAVGSGQVEGSAPRDPKELWQGQWDFTLIALAGFLLQAGSFSLAAPFLTSADLGLIRGAERLAVMVSFPILAINPFIAAQIVHHIVDADREGLRRTMRRAMLSGAAVSLPLLLAFIAVPGLCLGLLGPKFVAAAPYLRYMALANFAIVLFGPAAMAMNMGRLERKAMLINTSFLVLGLVLFPFLTWAWQLTGFVVAYGVIAVARSVLVHMSMHRFLIRRGF